MWPGLLAADWASWPRAGPPGRGLGLLAAGWASWPAGARPQRPDRADFSGARDQDRGEGYNWTRPTSPYPRMASLNAPDSVPSAGAPAERTPADFDRLVRDIRLCEQSMGDGVKRVYEEEIPVMKKLRRVGAAI